MVNKVVALPEREVWIVAGPTLVVSLAIAELFYKFHSFILEGVAMLATWWVLTTIVRLLLSLRKDAAS